MSSALLIIDVQEALCSGVYATHQASAVIARLNDLAQRFRAADALVVMVQHEAGSGTLARSEPGWRLAAALQIGPADLHLHKRASDAFHETNLHQLLRDRGITRLVVGGMQSEFCVDSTIRRALDLGFAVTPVSDGHTTLDNGVLTAAQISAHHNATWENITSYGVRAVPQCAADIAPHG